MKLFSRKATILFLLTSVALIAAQTGRNPYRYTNDLISVTAHMVGDLSYIEVTDATIVARDYRGSTTRVRFTMDRRVPNRDYQQVTFVPSGNVTSAMMSDGPALARCIFYSRGDAFVSPQFYRVLPLEQGHEDTTAMFCFRIQPRSRQVVLFVDFEDGTQAIATADMEWGVSSTDFRRKFRGKADRITGAFDVRRIALVDAPQLDTECTLQMGEYAGEASDESFNLDRPLLRPTRGIVAVNCQSGLAFDQIM